MGEISGRVPEEDVKSIEDLGRNKDHEDEDKQVFHGCLPVVFEVVHSPMVKLGRAGVKHRR